MRDDPFAELGSLDQKLFSAPSKTPDKGAASTSKKRKKERPDVRSEEQMLVGTKDSTSQRSAQRTRKDVVFGARGAYVAPAPSTWQCAACARPGVTASAKGEPRMAIPRLEMCSRRSLPAAKAVYTSR